MLKLLLFRFAIGLAALGCVKMPSRAGSSLPYLTSPTNTVCGGGEVRLGWLPSPSPDAAGYFVFWGYAPGLATNRLDAGNVTNAVLAGLSTNVTYYLTVVVYSATGQQGPPSNEIQYVPTGVVPRAGRGELSPALLPGREDWRDQFRSTTQYPGASKRHHRARADSEHPGSCRLKLRSPGDPGFRRFGYGVDHELHGGRPGVAPGGGRGEPSPALYRLVRTGATKTAPRLTAQLQRNATNAPAVILSFQGSAGSRYEVQATQDFINWVTVWTTNCTAGALVSYLAADVADYPRRFYRLVGTGPTKTGPRLTAQMQGNGTNAPALILNFQGSAGSSYGVQATQDFINWITVWTTNCTADVAVSYTPTDVTNFPQRFYRLVSQ